MATFGFVVHSERPRASELAKETASWLEELGHTAVILPEVSPQSPRDAVLSEAEVAGLDLLVSLGGDGTILRSVAMVIGVGVPVLGVNFGRFGYLTAVEPAGLQAAIERFLVGDCVIERRMTLDAAVVEGAHGGQPLYKRAALNDVVLARPSGMHTIRTSVSISGKKFLSYAADSMIVSTPTGSTGYNLSARGPIVAPTLRCLVLTPVSPHMLFDRSLVLSASDELSFRLEAGSEAELIVDGAHCRNFEVGQRLEIRAGANDAFLVSFGDRDFETVLKNKFRLVDR